MRKKTVKKKIVYTKTPTNESCLVVLNDLMDKWPVRDLAQLMGLEGITSLTKWRRRKVVPLKRRIRLFEVRDELADVKRTVGKPAKNAPSSAPKVQLRKLTMDKRSVERKAKAVASVAACLEDLARKKAHLMFTNEQVRKTLTKLKEAKERVAMYVSREKAFLKKKRAEILASKKKAKKTVVKKPPQK